MAKSGDKQEGKQEDKQAAGSNLVGPGWFVVEGSARCSWVLAESLPEAEAMARQELGPRARVGSPKPLPDDPRAKRSPQSPKPGERVLVPCEAPVYGPKDNCTQRDRELGKKKTCRITTMPSFSK